MSTTALTAVLAKFAGLNLAAKAGLGIAVAVGAVGAAAGVPAVVAESTGVGSNQVVVASTDEPTTETNDESSTETNDESSTETSDELATETSDETTAESTDESTDGTTAEPTDESTDATDDADEGDGQKADTFGAWVSAQARQGGVDGRVISEAAHARNQERRDAKAAAAPKKSQNADKSGAND